MKLLSKATFDITIGRAGHFYPKLTYCGVRENWHKHENGRDFQFINLWSYYIKTEYHIYWLWFRMCIILKPELLSGEVPQRYVRIEDTHLDLLNLPHGSWKDSNKLEYKHDRR